MISAKGGIQMLNNNFIKSVMKTYGIQKANITETETTVDIIIHKMNGSLSLEKWELMETVLKDVTNKKVNLIPHNQAARYLSDVNISKAKVI